MMMLFDELYQAARQRENREMNLVRTLWPETVPGLLCCVRVATAILEARDEFTEDLTEVSRRGRMRVRDIRYVCTECGDPDCPDAVPAGMLGPALLANVLGYLAKQK